MFLPKEKDILKKFKEDIFKIEDRLKNELTRISKEEDVLMKNMGEPTLCYSLHLCVMDEIGQLKDMINYIVDDYGIE